MNGSDERCKLFILMATINGSYCSARNNLMASKSGAPWPLGRHLGTMQLRDLRDPAKCLDEQDRRLCGGVLV
jgi:hypothetical protein